MTTKPPDLPSDLQRPAKGSRERSATGDRLTAEDLLAGIDDPSPGDEDAPESEAEHHAPTGDGTFPCEKCGADLRFKPGLASLGCEYCGHTNPIPEREDQIRELDFDAYLAKLESSGDDAETEDQSVLVCKTCGAQPEVDEGVTSAACPFCGSAIVTQATSRRLIKPKALLPFAVDRAAARSLFRKWISSRWFAPNELKRSARIDGKLAGVYLPHWTFDANTVTVYRGKRGVTRTTGTGKNRRTYTRWTSVSGVIVHDFDDVLVRASNSVPRKQADELEPWDMNNLVPYDDGYLAGFGAEAYAIDLREGWGFATMAMDAHIRRLICRDIGGDKQRITSKKTEHRGVTFKHILLPVWISAYRYRGKVYRFLVNGRTGEVQGERPWSGWKIALAVLAVAAVLGTGFLLVNIYGG